MDRLRMAGQPLPTVTGPKASAPPQRRPSPVHGNGSLGGRPGLPSVDSHASGLHLPAKTRRLSSSRLLRKENPSPGPGSLGAKKKSAHNLSASVGGVGFGSGGDGRARTASGGPLPDRKGKGKALPDMPAPPQPPSSGAQGMPPMTRQRSYSQPEPVQQPLRPLDYNLRPLPAGAGAPQPVYASRVLGGAEDRKGAALEPPFAGEYGAGPGLGAGAAPGASPARRGAAPPTGQVRMPARQGPTDSPQLGSDEVARKKQERDKALQRRKNAGEDKDCVVM